LSNGFDKWHFEVFKSSAVTGQGKYLLTPNLVHRKTKSSGKPVPKFEFLECSYEEGRVVEIDVPMIGNLRYLSMYTVHAKL